jgi:hypothetical protein
LFRRLTFCKPSFPPPFPPVLVSESWWSLNFGKAIPLLEEISEMKMEELREQKGYQEADKGEDIKISGG